MGGRMRCLFDESALLLESGPISLMDTRLPLRSVVTLRGIHPSFSNHLDSLVMMVGWACDSPFVESESTDDRYAYPSPHRIWPPIAIDITNEGASHEPYF